VRTLCRSENPKPCVARLVSAARRASCMLAMSIDRTFRTACDFGNRCQHLARAKQGIHFLGLGRVGANLQVFNLFSCKINKQDVRIFLQPVENNPASIGSDIKGPHYGGTAQVSQTP
jgi:hypothetical protein